MFTDDFFTKWLIESEGLDCNKAGKTSAVLSAIINYCDELDGSELMTINGLTSYLRRSPAALYSVCTVKAAWCLLFRAVPEIYPTLDECLKRQLLHALKFSKLDEWGMLGHMALKFATTLGLPVRRDSWRQLLILRDGVLYLELDGERVEACLYSNDLMASDWEIAIPRR